MKQKRQEKKNIEGFIQFETTNERKKKSDP